MTRINIGIYPCELCDQHLLAEYRELPRLWRYIDNPPKKAPEVFCLGKGHVLWCACHLEHMALRFLDLVMEMRHRGFQVNFDLPPVERVAPLPDDILSHARPILQDRIRQRLSEMKRTPTWTKRSRPEWVRVAA